MGRQGKRGRGRAMVTVQAEVGAGAAWEALTTTGWARAAFRTDHQGLLDEYDLLGDVSKERVGNGSEK